MVITDERTPARTLRHALWAGLVASVLHLPPACAQSVYEKDVAFALDEIGRTCARLIELKKIDWKKVGADMKAAARGVRTDEEHHALLVRLLARLQDGHARVERREKTKDLAGAVEERTGCGLFLCRIKDRLHLKTVWNAAKSAGLEPGSEVVSVDGVPAGKWLQDRMAKAADGLSFSTSHHALFFACHVGLAEPPGTSFTFEVKDAKGRRSKRKVVYGKAALAPWGPAVFPPGVKTEKDLSFGRTAKGFGYVHVRRCKEDLPAQMDAALAAVGRVPGLILDFRGNSGGGFDHEAFMGRFLPADRTLDAGPGYKSAGPDPYGGPMVVIVDGTVVSAGETASGIFKEDGRAYVIGESPTAGMSSQKTTIELPSGLFALYVSVSSNKQRFNGGRGLEGIGVMPHETVEFDPKDLAAGTDTLIRRAEVLLADFPAAKVPYRARP